VLIAENLKAGTDVPFMKAKITTAHFYAEHILKKAPSLRDSIVDGADRVTALSMDEFRRAQSIPAPCVPPYRTLREVLKGQNMRSFMMTSYDTYNGLSLVEVPVPEVGKGQVRIRIEATALVSWMG
jgi:hypothetical protein